MHSLCEKSYATEVGEPKWQMEHVFQAFPIIFYSSARQSPYFIQGSAVSAKNLHVPCR